MWKNEGTGATVDGKFTNGGPGVDRSILGAEFLNMILAELQNAVTQNGLSLDEGDNAQLAQVIRNLGHTTGDGKITLKTAADPGWVMANDGTIGSLTSGATTLAHASAQALYTLLWTNVLDDHAPVTGGRGVSAAADWGANKPIALTKQLGRAIAVAGAGAGGLTARALGQALGAETHALTAAENGPHDHPIPVFEPDDSPGDKPGATPNGNPQVGTGATASSGAGDPHNNMQPTSFWNVMIKL